MVRWYLIHTKPLAEALAQTHLERQGYETYLPRLAARVRRGGRLKEQIIALFPRYLFLCLREGVQSLAPVRSSVGVASVVRFGPSCVIVADRIISELRAREDACGFHRLIDRCRFSPGDAVRVMSGAFDGLEGVFEREAGADRVVVLLRLLGQDARVRIPVDFVEPRRAA